MVGIDKAVTFLQIKDVVNLSGEDEAVASQNRLAVNGRCYHFVEMDNLYQMAAVYIAQACFSDCHTDVRIV